MSEIPTRFGGEIIVEYRNHPHLEASTKITLHGE
jgi:hypothetical protein